MSVCIVFAVLLFVSTALVDAAALRSGYRGAVPQEISSMFGARAVSPRSVQQNKRDLSLSYAATNIDSKEGTRVKTITVIKNHDSKNIGSGKLAINPELHKSEEWAKAFHDNFDSYGTIPDVPDIDDLFEFMNKKKQPKESKDTEKHKADAPNPDKPDKDVEKPVSEASAEVKDTPSTTPPNEVVEKIKGDAEVIGSGNKRHSTFRSQSISLEKQRLREPLISVNFSTPSHSVRQYFENYVDQSPKGYNYAKPPCTAQAPPGSVSVTTPSGRTYDIPTSNSSARPYLAPGVARKPSALSPPTQGATLPRESRPVYSVNSILPPLQPTSGPVLGVAPFTTSTQRVPVQPSTSQRPYVAPNLRNGAGANRSPPPAVTVYHNEAPNFRTNIFGFGANKPNTARSRGLKY